MSIYSSTVRSIFPKPAQFSPDFSFMDKMLQRREAMYEKGFAQLAGKWQYIARETTNSKNSEIRNNFLKEAKENLKNISSLDLAEFSNVEAASQVFTPFVKNSNVIGDQELTEHWSNQENIAESYRLKDGGKEFSEDNINYVRMQKNAFANDDPSNWKSYYNQKRMYSPYYDYNKEVAERMEKFKPSSYKYDSPNGYYIMTEESSGAKVADIKRYLNATLSDKAKQQMRIESSVRLGSNPKQLFSTYTNIADRQIEINNETIKLINTKLLTEKNPEKVKNYNKEKTDLQSENESIITSVEKIKKGDTTGINTDELAYSLYFNSKVDAYSNGYSYKNVSRTIKSDGVKLAIMAQNAADARQQRMFTHQRNMLFLKSALEKKKGLEELGIEKGVIPGVDPSFVKGNIEGLSTENQQLLEQGKQLDNTLRQTVFNLVNQNPAFRKLKNVNEVTDELIRNITTSKDPRFSYIKNKINTFQSQIAENQAKYRSNESFIQTFYTKASEGLSSQEKKEVDNVYNNVSRIGNITINDGRSSRTITGTELFIGINNGTIKVDESYLSGQVKFTINGKSYTAISGKKGIFGLGITSRENVELLTAYNQIKKQKQSPGYQKFATNLENVLQKTDVTTFSGVIKYDPDSKLAKSLTNTIATAFAPGDEAKIQLSGIGSTTVNQGDVYVKISGKNLTEDDIEAKLASHFNLPRGSSVRKVSTSKGGSTYIISGLNHPLASSMRTSTDFEKNIIRNMTYASPKPGSIYQSVNFKVGEFNYVMGKDSNGLYYLYCTELGLDTPVADSDNPSDLMTKAKLLNRTSLEKRGSYTGQTLEEEDDDNDYEEGTFNISEEE